MRNRRARRRPANQGTDELLLAVIEGGSGRRRPDLVVGVTEQLQHTKVQGRGTSRFPHEYLYRKLGLVGREVRTRSFPWANA